MNPNIPNPQPGKTGPNKYNPIEAGEDVHCIIN